MDGTPTQLQPLLHDRPQQQQQQQQQRASARASARAARQDALIAAVRDNAQEVANRPPLRRVHRKKKREVVGFKVVQPANSRMPFQVVVKGAADAPVVGRAKPNEFIETVKKTGSGVIQPIERNPFFWIILTGVVIGNGCVSYWDKDEHSALIGAVFAAAFETIVPAVGMFLLLSYFLENACSVIFPSVLATTIYQSLMLLPRLWLVVLLLNFLLSPLFIDRSEMQEGTSSDIRSWNLAKELIKYVGAYLEEMPNRHDGWFTTGWKSFWVLCDTHGFFSMPSVGTAVAVAAAAIYLPYASPAIAESVAKGLKLAGPVANAVVPIGIAGLKGGNAQFGKSLKGTGLENLWVFVTSWLFLLSSFAYTFPAQASFISTKVSGLQFANQYYSDFFKNVEFRLGAAVQKRTVPTEGGLVSTPDSVIDKFRNAIKGKPDGQEQGGVAGAAANIIGVVAEGIAGIYYGPGKEEIKRKEVLDVENALLKLLPPAGVCDSVAARTLLWLFPLSPLSGTVTDVWSTDPRLESVRARSINLAIAANDGLLAAKISEINRIYGKGLISWFLHDDSPKTWLMNMTYTLYPAAFTAAELKTITAATEAFDDKINDFYSYKNISENRESFKLLGFNTDSVEKDAKTNNGFIGMERLHDMLGFFRGTPSLLSSSMNIPSLMNIPTEQQELQKSKLLRMVDTIAELKVPFLADCAYCSDFSKTPWMMKDASCEWDISRGSTYNYPDALAYDQGVSERIKDWRKAVEAKGDKCGIVDVYVPYLLGNVIESVEYCRPANSTSFEARIEPVCKTLP